jgi:hypothetical protein
MPTKQKDKMKLELKHIAPYLSYKLKFHQGWSFERGIEITLLELDIHGMANFSNLNGLWDIRDLRPILRPISDLTKEIEVNEQKFVPIDKLKEMYNATMPDSYIKKLHYIKWDDQFTLFGLEEDNSYEVSMPYGLYEKLFEWNFDVFGLLDAGLAVDINTLKN